MTVIRSLRLRRALRSAIPFVFIPLLAVMGSTVFDEKRHMIVSIAAALLSLLLFMSGYEKRNIGTRRAVLSAVMIALSSVGRFIPFFKPVTALTVISGAYLGGEAGFLVGAMSAFISNMYFGQGPWTPFQMLGWGLIGLVSGFISRAIRSSRAFTLIWGALSGAVFSLIMDVWTVLWYDSTPSLSLYASALITALPHTLLYAVSNVIFLYLLYRPLGEKLERVKIKYGI